MWTRAELGSDWTEQACSGIAADGDGTLVALAGRFVYSGSAEDLLARFGAVSTLKGLPYWSVTEGGWRTLITQASALQGPDATKPRPDFTARELRAGPVYFMQEDNRASGEVVYRMRVRNFGPDGFAVAVENASAVTKLMVTLFNPGDLQSVHFLTRQGADEWSYYGLAWAGDSLASRLAVPQASFANRALALYRHFARQASPR